MKQKFQKGKDGRMSGARQAASSGKGKEEQALSEADINKAFALWEANPEKKPEERLSKKQIAKDCGIPIPPSVRGFCSCNKIQEEHRASVLCGG